MVHLELNMTSITQMPVQMTGITFKKIMPSSINQFLHLKCKPFTGMWVVKCGPTYLVRGHCNEALSKRFSSNKYFQLDSPEDTVSQTVLQTQSVRPQKTFEFLRVTPMHSTFVNHSEPAKWEKKKERIKSSIVSFQ